jgi:hypothetical protein
MERTLLINEDKAANALARLDDPIVRNLITLVTTKVLIKHIRSTDEPKEVWEQRLPDAPFDLNFMVEVLAEVFSRKHLIRGVLDGGSLAEVTGWDF